MNVYLNSQYDKGAQRLREKEVEVKEKSIVLTSLIVIAFVILVPVYSTAEPLDNFNLELLPV